jgi:hypothetical protein
MAGNIPGYMPQKQGAGGESSVQFSIVFNFEGRGAERIVMTPADHATGPASDFTTVVDVPELIEPLPVGDEEDDVIEEDV